MRYGLYTSVCNLANMCMKPPFVGFQAADRDGKWCVLQLAFRKLHFLAIGGIRPMGGLPFAPP